jgi:hypothetical protein
MEVSETESYEQAMFVVEDIIKQMIENGFDYETLEELRQRIR